MLIIGATEKYSSECRHHIIGATENYFSECRHHIIGATEKYSSDNRNHITGATESLLWVPTKRDETRIDFLLRDTKQLLIRYV